MRKIGILIRNIYRVFIVKPDGNRMVINCSGQLNQTGKELLPESTLRQIIADDELAADADPLIREMLSQRVKGNGSSTRLAKNSLLDIFLPVFSLNHIELKMAFISIALVIALGISPTNNHSASKNLNGFMLADTLNDTSVFHLPAVYDSAWKVQYK